MALLKKRRRNLHTQGTSRQSTLDDEGTEEPSTEASTAAKGGGRRRAAIDHHAIVESVSKVEKEPSNTQLSQTSSLSSSVDGNSRPASLEDQSIVEEATKAGKAYQAFLPAKEKASSKITIGPRKSNPTVGLTTFVDYQPDVCKDYKETGYCGFGDTCKFLHDRSDYKAGWQIDREWEEMQRNKRKNVEDDQDTKGGHKIDPLPSSCYVCHGEYVNPVQTRCGHQFCEACALKSFRETATCAICGARTLGAFSAVKKDVKRKLNDN